MDTSAGFLGLEPKEWGVLGLGGALALPGMLAGSKTDPATKSSMDLLGGLSKSLQSSGTDLTNKGTAALAPVLSYLTKLAGGDTAAAMDATRPQRARVIDQYDAARKSIAEFSPRGGGTASTLANSQFKEAGDLANLTSQARTDAVNKLGDIGQQLTSLGVNTTGMSAEMQARIAAILSDQAKQKREQQGQFGKTIGSLLGAILLAA